LSDSDRKDGAHEWPAVDRRAQVDRRGLEREAAGHRTRRSGHERRDESAWESVPLELTLANDKDETLAPAQTLVAAAADARTRAHARYSGFKVGAALETTEGQVVTGCNIENATYGLTLCAERVALVKALSDGHSIFTRIAVVADTEDPTPPCGPCRQLLWEYCGDIDVILANLERTTATLRLSALLPMPFDNRLLE
jgi:cytidine deaminase